MEWRLGVETPVGRAVVTFHGRFCRSRELEC